MPETHLKPTLNLQNPVVLFDGVCNLCNTSVQFILKHDEQQVFKFASLQSDTAEKIFLQLGIEKPKVDSIILIENGKVYTQSDAVLRIGKQLNTFVFLLKTYAILPHTARNLLYNIVAKYRYFFFGKQAHCILPTPELKHRFEIEYFSD